VAVYGPSVYGTSSQYGLDALPSYLCGQMAAQSTNYDQILVTWTKPLGVIFRYRLLSSRAGYPVNENDGTVLIDQAGYPGSIYIDQNVVPGTYKYYGLYVQISAISDTWLRSGVAACLTNQNHGSAAWIENLIPSYYRSMPDGSALPLDAHGLSDLDKFCLVIGWGLDYAKTQYAMFADHVNDPTAIPLNDLWRMAAELGLEFSPETDAATVRKAVANATVVFRQRGTIEGIQAEISMKTNWDSDVQIGQNIMLEDDQSQFISPIFLPYDANRVYTTGDVVYVVASGHPPSTFFPSSRAYWYNSVWSGDGYWYSCLTPGTIGVAPPADGTTNATWQCIRDWDDWLATLANAVTGGISTWELLTPANTNGVPTGPTPFLQGLGVAVPASDGTQNALNSLRLYNKDVSPSTMWARSLARTNGVVTGSDNQVDHLQVIKDAIPVPWVLDDQAWNAGTEYATNDLVLYQGQSFIALRQSTGATPPTNNAATPEWAPLSYDRRIRLMVSALTSQNMTNVSDLTAAVVPFVEWYDQWGAFIGRVFARNSGTDPSRPDALTFDSFTTLADDYLGTTSIFNWVASFYNNVTRTAPIVLSEPVTDIDFQWNSQSPGVGVNTDGWSVNFTGSFVAPVTGVYTFGVSSSDGSAVWVNGVQIINNWAVQAYTHATGTVSLVAGDTADVIVAYFRGTESDVVTTTTDWSAGDGFPGWAGISADTVSASVIDGPVQAVVPNALVSGAVSGSWAGAGVATLTWLDSTGTPIGIPTIGDEVDGNTSEVLEVSVSGNAPANAAWVYLGAMLGTYDAAQVAQHIADAEAAGGALTFGAPGGGTA
jgi:hypothetical protein